MNKLLVLAAAIAMAAVSFGGHAPALEVGEQTGLVIVSPGAILCDTAEHAEQAIDILTPPPASCGRLQGLAYAVIKAESKYEFGDAVYLILKLTFVLPVSGVVQYGWKFHSKIVPDTPA